MQKNIIIAPSLLAADFANLQQEVTAVTKAGADWLHLDVMDGNFVKNLTFGPPTISAIRPHTPIPFDAHLMVKTPQNFIDPLIKAGVDHITFHLEATPDPRPLLKYIQAQGKKAGLSIQPETDAIKLVPYLNDIDIALIMTVAPGFGGQPYMPEMAQKVSFLKKEHTKHAQGNHTPIFSVDGGITPTTAIHAQNEGANCFVAGSAIFKHNAYGEQIKNFKKYLT